jgi:hypothetical protein
MTEFITHRIVCTFYMKYSHFNIILCFKQKSDGTSFISYGFLDVPEFIILGAICRQLLQVYVIVLHGLFIIHNFWEFAAHIFKCIIYSSYTWNLTICQFLLLSCIFQLYMKNNQCFLHHSDNY